MCRFSRMLCKMKSFFLSVGWCFTIVCFLYGDIIKFHDDDLSHQRSPPAWAKIVGPYIIISSLRFDGGKFTRKKKRLFNLLAKALQ